MLAIFPGDMVLVEEGTVGFGDGAAVRDKDVEALFLRQDSGSAAGFACA